MKETNIQRNILLGASQAGCVLFRNNTGQAWAGQVVKKQGQETTLFNARPIKFGLCVGSSDLIGYTPIKITPKMVGKTIAVFTAIEVKTPKKDPSSDQRHFISVLQKAGAFAGLARSNADLRLILKSPNRKRKAKIF